ncbi:MAG TPA: 2-phospho-L-lactate guanylyltransferase [Candidatus Limnocylindria bacterium]|nr:2-phospho-L-lactate guanylyltransferase [Candidatus Limnocylindria bacterium]
MSTRIIVPHRGLEHAKTRLAGVLEPAERSAVAERLLRHVLEAAVGTGHEVVVISPEAALEELVVANGARLAVQHGLGLNSGLREARTEAIEDGVTVLAVIHGDLPELTREDMAALIDAVGGAGRTVAIAPDALEAGTNGLAQSPPDVIAFQFGVGSFAAHRGSAIRAGAHAVVIERPGLAFDVDTPADLAAWVARGFAA